MTVTPANNVMLKKLAFQKLTYFVQQREEIKLPEIKDFVFKCFGLVCVCVCKKGGEEEKEERETSLLRTAVFCPTDRRDQTTQRKHGALAPQKLSLIHI